MADLFGVKPQKFDKSTNSDVMFKSTGATWLKIQKMKFSRENFGDDLIFPWVQNFPKETHKMERWNKLKKNLRD